MITNIYCCSVTSIGISAADWFAAAISVCTLLVNVLFYIIIAPRISFRFQKKEELLKCATDFLAYLSGVNSFDSFEGVPTKVKSYCIAIKLLFKKGVAPKELDECMENVYKMVKKRKTLNKDSEITAWEEEFRIETHNLRVMLARYTGIFK